MNEQLAWAELSSIAPLVAACRWNGPTWMYLEHVPAGFLDPNERRELVCLATFDASQPFDAWARGRIFDAEQELRWEPLAGGFHAVYCGAQLPPGLTAVPLHASSVAERPYYLWGQQVRPDDRQRLGLSGAGAAFIELRVPRVLSYPVSSHARRVQVLAREWRGNDGRLAFVRWCGVQEETA